MSTAPAPSAASAPIQVGASLAADVQALRHDYLARRGAAELTHIYKVMRLTRRLALAGRILIMCGLFVWPLMIAGVIGLALAKILENMEIGHNVMHGQYLFSRDPALSADYEWDVVAPGSHWRRAHNQRHHVHTSIQGVDDDVGALRLFPEQPWHPVHRLQPLVALLSALLFQWGVAAHNMGLGEWRRGRKNHEAMARDLREFAAKALRQVGKDYVLFPLLAGPFFLQVMAANLVANGLRNVWAWAVILCNHGSAEVEVFVPEGIDPQDRDDWYRRQIVASANFSGPAWLHLFSGHLGYHIEHHLFPEIPASMYPAIAIDVRALCEKHQLPYLCAPFHVQLAGALARIVRYARPNPPAHKNQALDS